MRSYTKQYSTLTKGKLCKRKLYKIKLIGDRHKVWFLLIVFWFGLTLDFIRVFWFLPCCLYKNKNNGKKQQQQKQQQNKQYNLVPLPDL